jgi:hypothetical protein
LRRGSGIVSKMSMFNESNAQGRPAPTANDATASSAPNINGMTTGISSTNAEELVNRAPATSQVILTHSFIQKRD